MLKPRTPKLPGEPRTGAKTWYRYYAGFSADFVRDVLKELQLGGDQMVADPWNGSGTTTAVADELGLTAWGGDINPAMVVIAKARLLGWRVRPSEISLCEAILESRVPSMIAISDDEPLRVWFRADSAGHLRALERSTALLLDPGSLPSEPAASRVSALSPLAAFFYLALFRTVRQQLKPFRCSNPTWIRRPKGEHRKLFPSARTIENSFRQQLNRMMRIDSTVSIGPGFRAASHLRHYQASEGLSDPGDLQGKLTIEVAKSTALPFAQGSVDVVVSSPPYCTRIDYAIATSPELAILGMGGAGLRALRETMIGSSTVRADAPTPDTRWGNTCKAFLNAIKRHSSKASATYYLRNHLQYFDGLFRSLCELDRVLQRRAPCVLVVQDSHYKEVHNDLPRITSEMVVSLGWQVVDRHYYKAVRHLGRIHRKVGATETVLMCRTAS